MKKMVICCSLFSSLFMPGVRAQYYFQDSRRYGGNLIVEAGAAAGIMNCLTDLGGRAGTGKRMLGDLNLRSSRPSAGIFTTLLYRDRIGLQLQFTYGTALAYDSVLQPVAASTFGRYERNLSFRSRIMEFQATAEVHPLFFRYFGDDEAPYWSPYFVIGIGAFHFNPEAKLNEKWIRLRPLHTEGQGFPEYPGRRTYSTMQLNIPAGIGLRYELSPVTFLRLELIHRFLFTDYLDDVSQQEYIDPAVFSAHLPPAEAATAASLFHRGKTTAISSQRGNPANNDSYFTLQFKFGFLLPTTRRR